jgi:hypothetical protein
MRCAVFRSWHRGRMRFHLFWRYALRSPFWLESFEQFSAPSAIPSLKAQFVISGLRRTTLCNFPTRLNDENDHRLPSRWSRLPAPSAMPTFACLAALTPDRENPSKRTDPAKPLLDPDALFVDLRLNELCQVSQRLLPTKITSLRWNDVRHT